MSIQQRLDLLEQEVHSFSNSYEIWNYNACKSGHLFGQNNSSLCPHLPFCFFWILSPGMWNAQHFHLHYSHINKRICSQATASEKRASKNISHLSFFPETNLRDWFYVTWNTIWAEANKSVFLMLIQRAIRNSEIQTCRGYWDRYEATSAYGLALVAIEESRSPLCVPLPFFLSLPGSDRMFQDLADSFLYIKF